MKKTLAILAVVVLTAAALFVLYLNLGSQPAPKSAQAAASQPAPASAQPKKITETKPELVNIELPSTVKLNFYPKSRT